MIETYLGLFRDEVRIDAFRRAIMQTVRRGDVVVDLGTGLGTFAIFACQAGAKKVYAIEDSDAIEAARELARANNFADNIIFLKDNSLRASLPEKADLLITEAFWSLFAEREFERTLMDARARFLKPRGRIMPEEFTLFAAPAEAPSLYEKASLSGKSPASPPYNIRIEPLAKMALNAFFYSSSVGSDQLLTEAAPLVKIKLKRARSLSLDCSTTFNVKKGGDWHFTALWLALRLSPEVTMDNSPGSRKTAWKPVLLPIESPIRLVHGDTVAFNLKTSLFKDDFIWTWSYGVKGASEKSGLQSTLFSSLALKKDMEFILPRARPALSNWGKAVRYILGCIDGQQDLLTIAQMARRQFPELFDSEASSLAAVREVSRWGCA